MGEYTIYLPATTTTLESDTPLTVREIVHKVWGQRTRPKYYRDYFNKVVLSVGVKSVVHWAGSPVGDDEIIPLDSAYPVQIWGQQDRNNPLLSDSTEPRTY